jgi:hypothetical protein
MQAVVPACPARPGPQLFEPASVNQRAISSAQPAPRRGPSNLSHELRRRCDFKYETFPFYLQDFTGRSPRGSKKPNASCNVGFPT